MNREQLTKTRQMILDRFLGCLERSPGDWQKQWIAPRPMQNGNTGKAYRGINQLLLSNIAEERGYQDCRWYTFHQVTEAGWHLQNAKGHGVPVEYWSPYDTVDKKMVSWKEMHRLLLEQEREDGDFSLRCKTYTVFNGDLIPELEPLPLHEALSAQESNRLAEQALQNYLKASGVTLHADNPNQTHAFYRPSEDAIYLPVREHFFSLGGYFGTAFHEVAHSTSHPDRLNRPVGKEFGDDVYAKEELIAEISSTLICGELGLNGDDLLLENHEAYVQSWISELKEKPSILFTSIQSAQKATDYVLETAEVEKLREEMQGQQKESSERHVKPYEVVVYHHLENGFDAKLDYLTLSEAEQAAQKYVSGTTEGENGFAYDGAGVYDLQENRWLRVYGNFPDERAIEQTAQAFSAEKPQQPEDRYTIYQVKREDFLDFGFLGYDEISKLGRQFSSDHYREVYSGKLNSDTTLDDLYLQFNVNHPADFTGHSLSMSDVVVLHRNGKDAAYYCDSFGWIEVPKFLEDKQSTLKLQDAKKKNQYQEVNR